MRPESERPRLVVCGRPADNPSNVFVTLDRLTKKLKEPIICIRPCEPLKTRVWSWCMLKGHTLKIFREETDAQMLDYVCERKPAFLVEFEAGVREGKKAVKKSDPLTLAASKRNVKIRVVTH